MVLFWKLTTENLPDLWHLFWLSFYEQNGSNTLLSTAKEGDRVGMLLDSNLPVNKTAQSKTCQGSSCIQTGSKLNISLTSGNLGIPKQGIFLAYLATWGW